MFMHRNSTGKTNARKLERRRTIRDQDPDVISRLSSRKPGRAVTAVLAAETRGTCSGTSIC